MTGPDHDAEFEAFLKRRSPMHRRLADFDHAEPPMELDRLVLSRAREAIDTPAQPPMFRTARWAMPLGLAATILIAFTVVLNVDHRAQPAEKPVASTKASRPVVPAAQLTANLSSDSARVTVDERRAAAPAAARELQDSRLEKKAERAPLLASTRAGYVETLPPPPTAEAAAAESEADPAAPASPPAAAPPAYQASAESWLREINRLRAAGKTADADRELTAFRQAYPSHPGHALARPPTR